MDELDTKNAPNLAESTTEPFAEQNAELPTVIAPRIRDAKPILHDERDEDDSLMTTGNAPRVRGAKQNTDEPSDIAPRVREAKPILHDERDEDDNAPTTEIAPRVREAKSLLHDERLEENSLMTSGTAQRIRNAKPLHNGHRARMKARFREHGMDNFDDHNVLEMLLFFSKPRGDTNPTAHELINRFGSLSEVFDAPFEELEKTPGIGETSALLIKLIPQVARRYLLSRTVPDKVLDSSRRAGEYLMPYFFGERDECVYLVCLDAKCKVLATRLILRGSVNSAAVNVRKIVEVALSFNSTSVVLAHNHTSGIAIPSAEDKATTTRLYDALAAVDINLADHIVVADDDFVSFADNGFFRHF